MRVLVVDHDPAYWTEVQAGGDNGVELTVACSADEALRAIEADRFDTLVVEQDVDGTSGVELLARARGPQPTAWRLVMGSYAAGGELLAAIDRGDVHRVLQRPSSLGELRACVTGLMRATHRGMSVCVIVDRDEVRARQIAESLYGTGELLGIPQRTLTIDGSPALMLLVTPRSPRDVEGALHALGGPSRKSALMVVLPMEAVQDAAGYIAAGADEVLWLPLRADEVKLRLRTWRHRRASDEEAERVREEVLSQPPLPGIIGRSEPMRRVFQWIHRVAPTDSSVLLLGETGTGKELIARTIHRLSARRDGPFVAVNLSALPETLIESELFGHTSGAFTGARGARDGLLEKVAGGTLFLDEVGDLSMAVQVKLLRVLEERQFTPLGSNTLRSADFRLVCATHRDLDELIAAADFREDLYYRINVVHIDVPPLRRRKGDIQLLAESFLERYQTQAGLSGINLGAAALEALERHDWPGNIRELEHIIERAVALSRDGDEIGPDLIRSRPNRRSFREDIGKFWSGERGLREVLEDIERHILVETLQRYDGNRVAAARKLKIPRQTLQSRLKKLKIDS